ncbi:general stress protein [Brevibacillus sp. DP1.3A]|uniref:general stress protein n=1 Tax=Brevibacillus sp. DP1.3A TaxID=2738867 RepID=UPI00156AF576|nr:general stress protein [Brevibacillus sp. DP1.3A]UED75790.1 general stress protein [Brevibacillus sp. DP1.3A]
MKKYLEARFSFLYIGEACGVIGFLILSFPIDFLYPQWRLFSLYSFWASFFLLEFLLLQGSVYWYFKWKGLKRENRSITPLWLVLQLKHVQKINIFVIILAPVLFMIDVWRWQSTMPVAGLTIVGGIYALGVLEYINYFHVQLSYDNRSDLKYLIKTKRLKQACIRKDFQRLDEGGA